MNDIGKVPLPKYLRDHGEEILQAFGNASRQSYDAEAWRSYFASDSVISSDLNEIAEKCPKEIGRGDVGYFARETRSRSFPEIRRLFLACMIWGYGVDPNGPYNTKLSLSDPRAEEVLRNTVSRISNSQIKGAYEELDLVGCRPAFFTKFFYFVGKECAVKPLPLILDRHVANFLRFLDEEEGWRLSLFAKTGRTGYVKRYPKGYVQYIHSMDDWAKALGCPADNIEYFMYDQDRKLEKAFDEVDQEGNPKIPIIFRRDGAYCIKCGVFLASPEPGVGFTSDKIRAVVWRHVCDA